MKISNYKNYILLVFVVIILLIFAEFILRINLSGPVVIYAENYEFNYTSYLNSDYFRDDEFVKEKDEDTFRIFLIGDSFVIGVGVEQKETIDKLLEKRIIEDGVKYSVYNLGMVGGPSEYYKTAKKFKEYNPDLVIVSLYVDNDIEEMTKYIGLTKVIKIIKSSTIVTSLQLALENVFKPNIYCDEWIKDMEINSFYKELMCKGKINPGLASRARIGDSQEYYTLLLKRFNTDSTTKNNILAIKKKNNVPFLLLINPSKYQTNTLYFNELRKMGFIFNQDKVVDRKLQDVIISWAIENEIDYLDILPFMKESNELFYHNIDDHYNVKGNYLVAEIIYNKLNEMQVLNSS